MPMRHRVVEEVVESLSLNLRLECADQARVDVTKQ
jgi:hypothetical protein